MRERGLMQDRTGATVWFTGLSGSGKTTLARAVAKRLTDLGWTTEVLDGDELRSQLSAGLGFSRRDREENARRAACMARALARHTDFVLVALISPYRSLRAEIAAKLPNFVEVFVNAPLAVCEARDPKGLYSLVRSGRLSHFTGIDDPYEPPLPPVLECRTDVESVAQSAQKVLRWLQREPHVIGNCVTALRAAIDAEPGIKMPAFAHRLGITPRALAARLQATGQNFRGLRDEQLLAYAEKMLRRGCAVKEVAIQLGFKSSGSFGRFYRRLRPGQLPRNLHPLPSLEHRIL